MKDKIIEFCEDKHKQEVQCVKISLKEIITKILPELERDYEKWREEANKKIGTQPICVKPHTFLDYLKAKYTK